MDAQGGRWNEPAIEAGLGDGVFAIENADKPAAARATFFGAF
jgi:hypothetical protein